MTNENQARTAGKLGKRPPKNAPALRLGPLLTGTIPDHPALQDNFAAFNGGWQMLGNDRYGDCVAVTLANVRRLMGAQYMTFDQVIEFYKTQNPGFPQQDNGMDIQTALEYLVKTGGPDGTKAVAFAKVDHTNPDEVKAAISIFGYVWTGIVVLQQNMTEFNQNEPWDWGNSPEDGGHSVVVGGYGQASGVFGGDERFITWAQETSFTDLFWSKAVDEAWVVIWPEHLGSVSFQQGISMAQLAADYASLTGKTLPVPNPPPSPNPTPSPNPQPTPDQLQHALRLLVSYIKRWVDDVEKML